MQRVVASTTIKVKPRDGTNGKDAQPPYVGENGNWFIWNFSQNKYVDSGNPAIGIDGKSPEIREGYWWLWNGTEWYNSGIKAKGEDSKHLEITGNTTLHNPTKVNGVKTTTLTAIRRNVESIATLAWQYNMGGNWQNTPWYTDSITIDYDTHSSLFQNGVLYLKCYVLGDPTIFKTISINVTNDGEDGRGVTSIVEQYYLSNSSTTQTGGSWVNHIPTWVSGKHIWSSSLITFTDSSTERVAVTLVPSLSGTSIVSVDVEYAKNQSRTTKPTTGWSTEAPTAQKGWFIWSRTKIVYSNSPTPSYTNVVCISGSDGNDGDNGSDGLSVYLGFNSYSYRVDANGFAIAKTLSIPIYAYQNKTRLNISASQISVSGFVPYGMNISKSTNTVTISVTSSFQPIPGGEGIVVYVEIDGATYLLNYNWSITQDGKSPYIGSNGNWYVWNGTSFVDSGDSATGDDGKSPEIRNGYWWAWNGTSWYNTGIKAQGKDGNSVLIRYMRADERPATPTTGVLYPAGWMTQIDNPDNSDIYWPTYIGEWTKQENGEYKSKAITHNENSPLRFVFNNRTSGSTIKITARTSSESADKLYIGKVDESLGSNYSNARTSFGGTQSQTLTYTLTEKGNHYILFDYKKDSSVNTGSDAGFIKIDFPIQTVWMTTCNIINGVATAWSTPSIFIDNRIEETIASADRSKAITDKFGTSVDGGLIQTVMMLLREANSETITAGISAIQGIDKDRPSFWSGGTHEEALGLVTYMKKIAQGITPTATEFYDLAPVTILHDGSAKVGSFIVERTGRIMLVNPLTGKPRLSFNASEVPPILELINGVSDGKTITVGSGTTSATLSLSGSTVVKEGSTAIFSGATITVNGSGRASDNNGMSSFVEASLVMYRSGSVYMRLGSALAFFTNQSGSLLEMDMTIIPQITFPPLPAGTYTFKLEVRKEGNVDSQSGTVTTSNFQWNWSKAGEKMFQFGTNGFMAFYSNNHMHFTEDNGLDIKGATNMPGVLLAGSVDSNGGQSNFWGAKVKTTGTIVERPSVGVYRIYHNIGHANYSVQVTPLQMSNAEVRNKYSTYFEVLMRGRGQHELQYAGFEFLVIGRNY